MYGVSLAAAADELAYPNIAALSWAHISAYCASRAAIAPVFCPKMFVATSNANWARLIAISVGGTTAAKAAS